MAGLVCPCSPVGRLKRPLPKSRFISRPVRGVCPLSITGILAGIYNEYVRSSSFVPVRGNTVAFIGLSCALRGNIFDGLNPAMHKSLILSFYDSFIIGFIGIYPLIFFNGVSLGAHWIHPV